MVDLPGILRKESKGLYEDQAGGVAQSDTGAAGIEVAAEEVGEAQDVWIGDRGVIGPWSLCSIKTQSAKAVAVIELFQLRTPEFSPETELMSAHSVGGGIGKVAGNVYAALRRCLTDAVKASDLNVRSAC